MITLSLVLVGCDNNIDESELVVRNDIHYQINSDKPFTGSVTSYHENGQKKNLGTYKKGLKDGLSEEFFSNGQLLSSVNYFMGGKEGVEKKYYENGNIQFVNNYKNSLLDGLKETYFDNGQLELKENYENGKLKEKIVRYDESGNEILLMTLGEDNSLLSDSEVVIRIGGNIIREGKIEGDGVWESLRKSDEEPFNGLIVAYDNGNLFWRGLVKNGLDNGPFETYHENGQLESKGSYEDGKQDGPFEWYHENGQLKIKGSFKDGKREDGPFEWYHENGQLETKGSSKDGKREGPFESYHENGQLNTKGSYKDDEIDGPYETWLESGTKVYEFYKDGERHGLYKFVNPDYSIFGEECYQNGEKVDLTVCESK